MNELKSKAALLLLSGGSLVGQNVVQALGSRRTDVRLLTTNSVVEEPSLQDFDEVRLVPPTVKEEGAFEKILTDWLEDELPSLVIPCRDDDVAFLARFAERRPDLAASFLCGAPGPAESMLDKWKSWLMSSEHGLPFAPSILLTDPQKLDLFVREQGFPLLVKPRSGFASHGVSLVLERSQLENWIGVDDMVVQKYLGYPDELDEYLTSIRKVGLPLFKSFESVKHSIQAMIAPTGELVGVFTTLHRMRNGVSVAVEEDHSDDAKALGEQCARVFSQLGWRGPLNIQSQRTPSGDLSIYEFNGRLTGATAARAFLGFDEVGMALRQFAGIDIGTPFTEYATDVLRQPASRTVPGLLRTSLETTGVWRR